MEQSTEFVTVTKLEAAERQLRAAIHMFFERRDMIAVHTLTAASHEVLSQLSRHHEIKNIYDHANDVIRPEKIKEFRYTLRKAQNFFKHAGKDSAEKLEFYYGGTQFLIFDAARLCSILIGRSIPECIPSSFIGSWQNFLNSTLATIRWLKPRCRPRTALIWIAMGFS